MTDPHDQRSSDTHPKQHKRIIVIGGVAAGTSAAAKARRNDEDASIVIYDMDRHVSYSGCGLPYYIGNRVTDINELIPRGPEFFLKKYRVEVNILHRVELIDPDRKTLRVRRLSDGFVFEDNYDILVIATGASSITLPVTGADLPHVFTLRNPSDAMAIKDFIANNSPRSTVIVGTGFIGLEMADNLALLGQNITLIEKRRKPCPPLDDDMADYLSEHLDKMGVRLLTGVSVASISDKEVITDAEDSVAADMVIVAIGVRPNTALAESTGIRLGTTGAIAVDTQMRTNIPDIFACGDCSENCFTLTGEPFYRPLGSTANKTGRITGDVMTGSDESHRGVLGTGIFETLGMTIATTGLKESEARQMGFNVIVSHNIKPNKPTYLGGKEMVIKIIADSETHLLLGVQIVGYEGVDKRIDVFVTAMSAGMKVEDLVHLDLAYAPPFSTTKDPVIYSGMILSNALNRNRRLISVNALSESEPASPIIIDTRIAAQFEKGHVDGAISAPHDRLREVINDLDHARPVITYCNKGTTGNAVQNILLNKGFKNVYNLSGGYKQYKTQKRKGNSPEDK